MTGDDLQRDVRNALATLSFAWVQTKPELLQTYHQMALDATPATRGMRAPLDPLVDDLILGTQIRPSQMQTQLLDRVLPMMLVATQSLAEDAINEALGGRRKISRRIEAMFNDRRIDRAIASEAHRWRITRNVVAHAGGVLDHQTVDELIRLGDEGKILFDSFKLWGPLLDAGLGGTLVPITNQAVATPNRPDSSLPVVAFTTGVSLRVGVADLLAAGQVWAQVIDAAN